MVRSDIVAGIINAVERGYSLQQAKQSLINANYNSQEIDEAIAYLSGSLQSSQSEYYPPPALQQLSQYPQSPQQQGQPLQQQRQSQQLQQQTGQYQQHQIQQLPQTNILPKPKKKINTHVIILLIILVLLLAGTIILAVLYKDKLLEFINTLTE